MGIFDDIKNKLGVNSPTSNNTNPVSDPNETAFGELPPIRDINEQTDSERRIATYVKNQVEEARTSSNRIAHEAVWLTNIAYLMGYSATYNPVTRNFVNNDSPTRAIRRNRVHENIILPAVQNRLARMLKNPPRYEVLPDSQDTDSEESARLGLQVINMVWDKEKINKKRIDMGMWLQECGHSYLKISWDPTKGEMIQDPITGEMSRQGFFDVTVLSALEGYPDPQAKSFEELKKFTEVKVRKLDYFKQHYPERGYAVKEEGAWLQSIQYEQRINSLTNSGLTAANTTELMKNSAIELNYYELPSEKYPGGRHIISANGVLLKYDTLPTYDGVDPASAMIPIAKFDDIVIGGKFFSESVITHARPLQDQYNRILQRTSDWENKLIAGKFIAARGHGLTQEALNDQSGEVVEYDQVPGASEPHAMQIPMMPNYVYTSRNEIKKSIYEIFGLGEISRGQLPYAGIPAEGIQLILEQDETRLGIEVEQHEHAYARLGELILRFAKKFVLTPMRLKVKEGGKLQFKTFTGEQITSFDCTVKRGSTIPNSKVLERQEIINAWKTGLLGNPQDPTTIEQVLGMIEFGHNDDLWKDVVLDKYQINQSIKQIEQGIPTQPNKLDNHALHIIEKNRYRKSDRFTALPPEYKKLLIDDILMHTDMAVGMINPQLEKPPVDPQHLQQMEQQALSSEPPGMPQMPGPTQTGLENLPNQ